MVAERILREIGPMLAKKADQIVPSQGWDAVQMVLTKFVRIEYWPYPVADALKVGAVAVQRQAIDLLRTERRHGSVPCEPCEPEQTPEDLLDMGEQLRRLANALSTLPKEDRRLVETIQNGKSIRAYARDHGGRRHTLSDRREEILRTLRKKLRS